MDNRITIAASLRSADWSRLGEEVKKLEQAEVDALHFDAADGHFIDDIAMGPQFVATIRKLTALPLDVHLMMEHPERMIPKYLDAGADTIILHWEATAHILRVLDMIHERGKRAGVAINPATSVQSLAEIFESADTINVMSVHPGFGGKIVPNAMRKISELQRIRGARETPVIQADGAVSNNTVQEFFNAGARSFVVGYPIFSQHDYAKAVCDIRALVNI